MKQGLSLIAKLAIGLMVVAVISICGILLPELAREEASPGPIATQTYLLLGAVWVLAMPIFIALFQAYKIVGLINNNVAFSSQSIRSLQIIKFCTLIFGGLIILSAMAVIAIAKQANPSEDITPVVTLGFVLIFVSAIIAAFVAVLQKLFQNAIDVKQQNDLTV